MSRVETWDAEVRSRSVGGGPEGRLETRRVYAKVYASTLLRAYKMSPRRRITAIHITFAKPVYCPSPGARYEWLKYTAHIKVGSEDV